MRNPRVIVATGAALCLAAHAAAQSGAPSTQPASPPKGDEPALRLANQMMEAMGGLTSWDKIPYLVFTFTVEKDGNVVASRKHYWDKARGRHRLEGNKEGKLYVVLTDLRGHKGTAYLGGARLEGDEAQKYLEAAYGAFINDSYWLAMPFKVKDPGVVLSREEPEVVEGVTYDRLKLSFESGVGLTPRDVYWAYIHPETRRMEHWAFVLGGGKEAPTVAEWKGYRQHRGVWLSDEKVISATGQRILFPDLAAPDEIPEQVFSSPEPVMPGEIPREVSEAR